MSNHIVTLLNSALTLYETDLLMHGADAFDLVTHHEDSIHSNHFEDFNFTKEDIDVATELIEQISSILNLRCSL